MFVLFYKAVARDPTPPSLPPASLLFIYVYTCIYIYIHIHTHMCIYKYVYICTDIYTYLSLPLSLYIYICCLLPLIACCVEEMIANQAILRESAVVVGLVVTSVHNQLAGHSVPLPKKCSTHISRMYHKSLTNVATPKANVHIYLYICIYTYIYIYVNTYI